MVKVRLVELAILILITIIIIVRIRIAAITTTMTKTMTMLLLFMIIVTAIIMMITTSLNPPMDWNDLHANVQPGNVVLSIMYCRHRNSTIVTTIIVSITAITITVVIIMIIIVHRHHSNDNKNIDDVFVAKIISVMFRSAVPIGPKKLR